MKTDTIPCERIFSNGSEFEWFIETQCEKCARFRNELCRIYRACCAAMWDASKFPYSDLLDFKDGIGEKSCVKASQPNRQKGKRKFITVTDNLAFLQTTRRSEDKCD